MSSNSTTEKYGILLPSDFDRLALEFAMMRKPEWELNHVGRSLFFHYRAAQSLLWPDDDHHRWSDLILKEILQNDITVLAGPKDSSKTYTMAKYALTDYFCHPENTLIIISSTDLRSLEGRVWGCIKGLYRRAKLKYPWLPGVVLDSKHAICTDDLDNDDELVRDMRKGLLCFPVGTLVDTPTGQRPIEALAVGDRVFNAIGVGTVKETFQRTARQIVRVRLSDGRTIDCTPEHPVFTNFGWEKACNLKCGQYMMSVYESMQVLQHPNPKQNFLQHELLREVAAEFRGQIGVLHASTRRQDFKVQVQMASGQPGTISLCSEENEKPYTSAGGHACKEVGLGNSRYGMEAKDAWWKRHWPNSGRIGSTFDISRSQKQLSGKDIAEKWKRIPKPLQGGRCISRFETSGRGRWRLSQSYRQEEAGRKENRTIAGAWVVSVTLLEPEDFGTNGNSSGGIEVHNVEVAGHPSYSVNGFLVHNCVPCKNSSGGQTNIAAYVGMKQQRKRYLADEMQFMSRAMYDSIANANSGNFKMVCAGNPIAQGDPLDIISEPKGGWDAMPEPTKTTVWDNLRFLRSRTVNLVGIDSPNFDLPEGEPTKFWYLVNRDSIARTVAGYGKNSHQYYSQCLGVRRSGVDAHKVLTRALCQEHKAFDAVVWDHKKPLTKVFGLDAAYGGIGGDRCIGGHIEYGTCDDGKVRIFVVQPRQVFINLKKSESPEDQIALWVKNYCEEMDIQAKNCFYDSTGRGSLGTAFARLWSAQVNPVEFGGVPSKRPVTHDLFITDERSGQKRLKRCDEHYRKFVTELWWTVRLIIESDQMRGMTDDLVWEGSMREWKEVAGNRIEIESKSDMKERIGMSPDMFDWLVSCCEGARRLGFQITKFADKDKSKRKPDWLDEKAIEYKKFIHSRELAIV